MLMVRTPFRLNFSGGSTDYPAYFSNNTALIISAAINKYSYVCVRRLPDIFNYKYYLQYSQIEKANNRDDIKHNGIRGTLQSFDEDGNPKFDPRLEVVHLSDLPSQTGIGSSSAFILSLRLGLQKLFAPNYPINKKFLAEQSIRIERKILKEPGGIADGISQAYGGLNSIHIGKDGDFKVKPLPVSLEFKKELQQRTILVYTGASRQSYQLASSHSDCQEDVKKLIHSAAVDMYAAFQREDINEIGRIVQEGWEQKRKLSPGISGEGIDSLLTALKSYGSLGSRLLGAGGSGFVMCIVDKHSSFQHKLEQNGLKYVTIEIDNLGTRTL